MAIETEEAFINLVRQAENEASKNSKRYNLKLVLFAILGYAVILFVFILLAGLAGGLIATAFFSTGVFILLLKKKVIVAVLLAMWVLLKALWIKFVPPKGFVLTRNNAPKLFDEIDNLRKELKSLKIHKVILDSSLNASVVQHPRLGILGWQQNYLIIGYRLLLTLSADQMRSVLAHEFGHLSYNHSRFAGWIYRIRLTWERIMNAFDDAQSWGAILMAKFFQWYAPKFKAYSFALARSNEYEADAIAAKLTSPSIAAEALINVYTTATYLDDQYWDKYLKYADDQPNPPHRPYKGLSEYLQNTSISNDTITQKLQEELSIQTQYYNTHPSLQDRLKALAIDAKTFNIPKINGAQEWLGTYNEAATQHFDNKWMNENIDAWKNRYEYVSDAREKLEYFDSKELAVLSDDELWSYAYLTQEFVSKEKAFDLFVAYETRYPEDCDAAYFIGKYLLEKDDESGIKFLTIARQKAAYLDESANLVYEYLKTHDRQGEAKRWWQECVDLNIINIEAQEERDSLKKDDEYVAPEIDDALLQEVIENLKQQPKVKHVWLAEKKVQHFLEDKVCVIAFGSKGVNFSLEKLTKEVADNLTVDGTFFVISKYKDLKPLFKKVTKVGRQII